jgi:hypothetical protein
MKLMHATIMAVGFYLGSALVSAQQPPTTQTDPKQSDTSQKQERQQQKGEGVGQKQEYFRQKRHDFQFWQVGYDQ